jgi:hypothetical protein
MDTESEASGCHLMQPYENNGYQIKERKKKDIRIQSSSPSFLSGFSFKLTP